MSAFTEFVLLFKTDSDGAVKGVKKIDDSTKAYEGTAKLAAAQNQKLGASFNGLAKRLGALAVAYVGVDSIIGGMKSAVKFADDIGKLADVLGANVEDVTAWGDAVKLSGGTAESFQSSIKMLTVSVADFAAKGTSRTAPFFQQLGISMLDAKGKARSFADLLPEISDAFQKISKEESFGIGRKLGLDEGTIALLQRGRREVDALIAKQKELGVVTKQDAEIAAKFNDAWDNVVHAFRSLFTAGNSSVLPMITKLLDGLQNIAVYLRKNPGYIKAMGAALGVVFAIFAPVAAVITAVGVALFLLAEDFIGFKNGHDSLIGDMLAKYPELAAVLRVLGKVAKFVFGGIVDLLKLAVKLIAKLFESIGVIHGAFEKLASVIAKVFSGGDKKITLKQQLESAGDAQESQQIKTARQMAAESLNFAATSPIGATPMSSITNASSALTRNTTVSVGEITVTTQATESGGIAQSIKQAMQQEFRQAYGAYDDSVVA